MSFLSLAKGDPAARELLQRAIRARYGVRPVPVESVRLHLMARRKGLLGLPIIVSSTLSIITATHWRWDQRKKLFGLPIGGNTQSFDGGALYEKQGGAVTKTTDNLALQGIRRRLWGEVASLLTPLTANDVVLKRLDSAAFEASLDNQPDDAATVRLNDDFTVSVVEMRTYRPSDPHDVALCIKPAGGLQTLNGFTVPKQFIYQWGDEPAETYDITQAEANPQIALTEFSLG